MEYIKIKPKHILFSGLSDSEIGRLVKLQCLVGQLDRMPTDLEISKIITKNKLISLENVLNLSSISLKFILEKVLEDVENVAETREYWKLVKRKQRKNISLSSRTVSDVSMDSPPTTKLSITKHNLNKDNIFTTPTLEEIKTYCKERQNEVDPNRFFDFYQSKGWMVGKNKMKDWRAAVRNWERENTKGGNGNGKFSGSSGYGVSQSEIERVLNKQRSGETDSNDSVSVESIIVS